MIPKYDIDKIRFATDPPTFQRAVDLYESNKVTDFEEDYGNFSALVLGTHLYHVSVSGRNLAEGNCDCYLGQNDTVCKHMVATAIYAVLRGEKLTIKDKEIIDEPKCSNRLGELNEEELSATKETITLAMKYIRAYSGPSRVWFIYQNSLCEGCHRLSAIVSKLPVNKQTAELLVNLLLRLDRKLQVGGVDDSDGTVGEFMNGVVNMLLDFVKLDKNCGKAFKKLKGIESCFGWEEPLLKIID